MNTNLTFDAEGYINGVDVVVSGFGEVFANLWKSDVVDSIIGAITAIVIIVLLWYGVRAILRALNIMK